jgi:hypothetical protein
MPRIFNLFSLGFEFLPGFIKGIDNKSLQCCHLLESIFVVVLGNVFSLDFLKSQTALQQFALLFL